jgi:aryl-alcohol dehydrogenase-like predicted oxidoreductase
MAQASLAFCLSHGAVATVIPGAMTEAELDEDVSAAGYAPLATDLAAEVIRRQIELGPAA